MTGSSLCSSRICSQPAAPPSTIGMLQPLRCSPSSAPSPSAASAARSVASDSAISSSGPQAQPRSLLFVPAQQKKQSIGRGALRRGGFCQA